MNRRATLDWPRALVVAGLATVTPLLLQNVLRDMWQIRTLPERVMEWLLLFVPLDLFERVVQLLGQNAKEAALIATFIGMAALLLGAGALALHVGWTSWGLLGLGCGMWLFAMAVVMPVTGAGFFATGLLIAPLLTNAGYFVVFIGYSSVLICGRLLILQELEDTPVLLAERRALLLGLVGTLAGMATARFAGREGGLVASSLPLASALTRQPAPTLAATATSAVTVPTPTDKPQAASASTPQAKPVVAPTPTLAPLPNPPPARRLARDKEGSLTAAGRAKGELASAITSNDDFFVVTKNAVADPVVDALTWRLVIDGEVNRPVQLDYRTLRALPSVEVTKTLECISNFTAGCNLTSFGCDLMSTARWKGSRLSDVLDLAGGLKPTAMGLAFLSTDEFSAGLLPDIADDPETLIVYEMNGEPLPREHGFPARLLVPGRYGMKNPKWLAGIRATPQEHQGWYEQRNWNREGIIKTMSRIDVPIDGATVPPGDQRLAGVAYAGDRGIRMVEFTTDDGQTWQTARILEPMAGRDALVRWESTFPIAQGQTVTITMRATDGFGDVQTEEFQLPQPDGASGRDSITVKSA
jgi:DMSO/TMAO reductase YedYZ molybdopterin-dependent catalytic subunit